MTHTALILAGHGSHISPQTAGIVWHYVDLLRTMQVADEVTAAFWKEAPSFHTVLATLSATDVTVVPLFTAQGYFTQNVIPAEMGLTGALTLRADKTIRYARTLGEHPYLDQIVQRRVAEGIQQSGARSEQIAVAILGHSTKRNPESRQATERQAKVIRQLGVAAEVVALYLDDEPGIADLYQLTQAPVVVAVPYFLALGSHTTIDVPSELGLPPGQTAAIVQGRRVYYTEPIGIDDELPKVIVELARAAGGHLPGSFLQPTPSNFASGFPQTGRAAFTQLLARNPQCPITFGQLSISTSDIRHVADTNRSDLTTFTEPATLRTHLRDKPFRPLATTTDLPGGWRVPITPQTTAPENPIHLPASAFICAVIETIYPGALADWAAAQQGAFPVNRLATVVDRQVGMFRRLRQLTEEQSKATVDQICGRCVRQPTWLLHDSEVIPLMPLDAARRNDMRRNEISTLELGQPDTDKGELPCSEPCNLWLSAALERITMEA